MNTIHRLACIGMQLFIISTLAAEPLRSVVMPDEETEQLFAHNQPSMITRRAYPITPISQEAIDKQHHALVQELKLNTLARYGVKATLAAVLVYMAYEVWASQTQRSEYAVSAGQGLKELTNAQLTAAFYEINPPRFSWQWIKNSAGSIGWSVINIALAKGVFDRVEQNIDVIMHNGNLDWFVKTHTASVDAITELSVYAHSHDTPGTAEREHMHHKEQVMQVTQSLMNDMTAILGFMSYCKSVTADAQIRVNMHTLIEYFRITCNEFAQSVTQALEHDTAVTPHFSKMNIEIHRALMSFMRLEREQVTA